jgi:putative nucleotidyltransferase with HDIG domain
LSEVDLHSSPAVANPELDSLLASFQDLPTIPEVLARIWQLVDDPRSSARDLEQVVSLEPPLAAKVLRLANSPYYGGRGRVKDVQMAITALGFDTLRNLAVCLSVASGLVQREARQNVMDQRELWRHSVGCAVVARRLARELDVLEPADAEELFTAGLLHDIGMFVVALGRPRAYAEVVRVGLEEGFDQTRAEREVLGFDHAEVGCAFAQRWHFPFRLQDLIANHHSPAVGDRATAKHVLSLADAVAHRVVPTAILPDFEVREVERRDLSALQVEEDVLDDLEPGFRRDIEHAQEFMNLV